MENNICNSMILTSRRRHFYLVGQSKHKPDGHGYELVSSVGALVPQKFSVEEELMHVKQVEVKSPHVGVMWKFGTGVISSGSSSESESDDDCLDSARDWCQIDITSPLPSHP
ncbi:hypothetical protein TNCV_2923971 [Trichonephila clavipes]|nr:hypothetical protein TNCV_2923971 [Trichonephila clavipes]